MYKRVFTGFMPYLLLIAVYGCSPATMRMDTPIIYPSPPEDPRIVYLKSYHGESDFKKRTWIDRLFGAPPEPRMAQPYGVAALGDKVYVTTATGVLVFDEKLRKMGRIGDRGTGRLSLPLGLAISTDGTVYVSDATLKKVYGYDSQGKLTVAIGKKGEFVNPVGIAINNKLGRLYVVDSRAHNVRVYSLQGESLFQFGSPGTGAGQFYYPSNVAVNQTNGNVFITDSQNFRVQVFDKDGAFLTKFGQLGDTPGCFSRPKGIGVDSEGHVYVVDAAFGNFQVFDETGNLLIFIGAPGKEPGYFDLPAGLYIDQKDRIFVVDSLNGRVQKFQYLSVKWKRDHPEEYSKYLLPGQQKTQGQVTK